MSWITAADVAGEIGLAVADDACTRMAALANAWALERRRAAGYTDDTADTLPSARVFEGTLALAVFEYKARGGLDGIPTFDGQVPIPAGTLGRINRLLGIPRAQVA